MLLVSIWDVGAIGRGVAGGGVLGGVVLLLVMFLAFLIRFYSIKNAFRMEQILPSSST